MDNPHNDPRYVPAQIASWGRLRQAPHWVVRPAFLDAARQFVTPADVPLLCYGMGRSYGDVCLNDGGRLIAMDRVDRILAFDREAGILRAEAGLTIDRLLNIVVPHGWFAPVVPGTKFVTLGGAVANDIHGKNHHSEGTFGRHVRAIGLARSSGEILTLSPPENSELFAATVGGLGLTGMILWVELQLAPIKSAMIDVELLPMDGLATFFRLSEESHHWPCTVAWIDCLARGKAIGRGFFIRGRPSDFGQLAPHGPPRLAIPVDAPGGLLNSHSVALFNTLYLIRHGAFRSKQMHYDPFYFPLDAVAKWNRLYGRHGFFQHQSAIPQARAEETLERLLRLVAEARQGSFLVVLKLFGAARSPGLMSFPLPGPTLALDFPNKGEETRRLLDRMGDIVLEAGGRMYPAKDATMSGEAFRAGYPDWHLVEARRDPAMMSDLWRRVIH